MSTGIPADQLARIVAQRDYAWAALREGPGAGRNGVAYANLLAVNANLTQQLVDKQSTIDRLTEQVNDLTAQLAECLAS